MPHVCPPVAGRVLEEPNVGRAGQEHPAAPRQDAVGEREPIGEGCAFFEPPVAVGILEQRHRAQRERALAKLRVAATLNDEHPPHVAEAQCHGIAHQRLGGGKLHPSARFDLKRPERLRRRKRSRLGDKRGWENGGKYGKSYHDATWLSGV